MPKGSMTPFMDSTQRRALIVVLLICVAFAIVLAILRMSGCHRPPMNFHL
jgi:hypothetical protein